MPAASPPDWVRLAEQGACQLLRWPRNLWHDDVRQAAILAAWKAWDEGLPDSVVKHRAWTAAVDELRVLTGHRRVVAPPVPFGVLTPELLEGSVEYDFDPVELVEPFTESEARCVAALARCATGVEVARDLGVTGGRVSQLVRQIRRKVA